MILWSSMDVACFMLLLLSMVAGYMVAVDRSKQR
jgi:hypothetical protein